MTAAPSRFQEHSTISRAIGACRVAFRRTLPKAVRDFLWYCRSRDLRAATRAAILIRNRLGDRVVLGPFSGMRYIRTAVGSSYPPKLLGTYEKELWPLIESLEDQKYQAVIDIGAAEGYYTVGLAWRFSDFNVIGFEGMVETHSSLRKLASFNGVEHRIDLRGWCTVEALALAMPAAGRALIISDCEGAESELLDPERIPALRDADILVEHHDFLVRGVSDLLRERFASTHDLRVIEAKPRTAADWPATADFVPSDLRLPAMAEHRGPGQGWYFFSAKANAGLTRPAN